MYLHGIHVHRARHKHTRICFQYYNSTLVRWPIITLARWPITTLARRGLIITPARWPILKHSTSLRTFINLGDGQGQWGRWRRGCWRLGRGYWRLRRGCWRGVVVMRVQHHGNIRVVDLWSNVGDDNVEVSIVIDDQLAAAPSRDAAPHVVMARRVAHAPPVVSSVVGWGQRRLSERHLLRLLLRLNTDRTKQTVVAPPCHHPPSTGALLTTAV